MSLVCPEEVRQLNAIERLLKREFKREIIPGYELTTGKPVDPNGKAGNPVARTRGSRKKAAARPGGQKRRNRAKAKGDGPRSRTRA